ncbi:MAG: helix-turn-helix domain-containing protein [Phenylobacterium sp.]|uniref:helix-turn-helix domain-containing protein n=2 Tax=Phenylobacterium sp. TaxID=1871053 RepID=UPI0025FC345F|nr:helix-turn-helix transcriptional regulator [Phenylobacterium sp.]MCG9915140.1 helix-turn-helix domain-containing protein [Phenylobacterium sp.]MDP1986440.1 helix-turn-helix transcriptional regulator [Phenylobacterium sp.]MDP3116930.1 helix-turn-helix transcriptional regulator [Phenylobacterium sp.]
MPLTIARSSGQIGRLIQRFRLEQGLTQTQLAQLAGQRQEMISKIETGQGGVKLSTLFDVLAALGLEMTLEPRSQSSTADIEDIF